jgi:hypothetical protein
MRLSATRKIPGTELVPGKKSPENFPAQRKSGKIFFWRERNFRKNISGKFRRRTHSKIKFLLTAQNPVYILPKYQFSDVIALAGNQGHLQPVSPEKPAIINAKKRCPQKPAILHGFIRFKIVILAK